MKLIVIGAVGGLAWAGGLRAYMSEIAGAESAVTWVGTMGGIVVPAMVVGSLLGWAEELRRKGGPRGWRALAWSPLLLPVVPLAMPGAITTLLTSGMGAGAIAVPLIGLAGAYAMKEQGRPWLRIVCGTVALSIIPLWSSASASMGDTLAVTTPRGALVALHFFALLAVLALAASLPLQTVVKAAPEAPRIEQETRSHPGVAPKTASGIFGAAAP